MNPAKTLTKIGPKSSISGDATIEETRLNTKGGSLTAILKKKLGDAFVRTGPVATGARLDFGDLASAVLLAPSDFSSARRKGRRIRITRMNERRFVVDLVDDTSEAVDPFTQAFLTMIVEQFKRGERRLVDRRSALAELDSEA